MPDETPDSKRLDMIKKVFIIHRAQKISTMMHIANIPPDSITVFALRLLAHQLGTIQKAVLSGEVDAKNLEDTLTEEIIKRFLNDSDLELDFILADENWKS